MRSRRFTCYQSQVVSLVQSGRHVSTENGCVVIMRASCESARHSTPVSSRCMMVSRLQLLRMTASRGIKRIFVEYGTKVWVPSLRSARYVGAAASPLSTKQKRLLHVWMIKLEHGEITGAGTSADLTRPAKREARV